MKRETIQNLKPEHYTELRDGYYGASDGLFKMEDAVKAILKDGNLDLEEEAEFLKVADMIEAMKKIQHAMTDMHL